jgi:hypothetical protein
LHAAVAAFDRLFAVDRERRPVAKLEKQMDVARKQANAMAILEKYEVVICVYYTAPGT